VTDQASGHGLNWLNLLAVDRIAAMREFLISWYPGPEPESTKSDVPAALAELYAIAASRPAVLGEQNSIYPPGELRTDPHEGLLVFAAENQGNFSWMIDPAEQDPVVWMMWQHPTTPVAERERLSGFLLQFCLFEAISSAPSQAFSWSEPAANAEQLLKSLWEVPLEPWHWPGDPTRFFVTPDLVLCTSHTEPDKLDILAGARSPDDLSVLAATDMRWDHLDA
jgi:hypothetical protein